MKSLFVKSIKGLDKKFTFVVLADLAFYVAVIISILIVLKLIAWSTSSLQDLPEESLDVTKITEMSQFDETLKTANTLIEQFRSRLALSIASLFILLLAVFSVFKAIPWALVKKQKLNKHYFKQFFKLNFWWFAGITLLIIIVSAFTRPSTGGLLALIILAIAVYVMPISYAIFTPAEKIKEIFKKTFYVGIERFYVFIIPLILSFILLLIISWIISITRLFLPENTVLILMLAGFVVWLSWLKYYIYLIVRGIK